MQQKAVVYGVTRCTRAIQEHLRHLQAHDHCCAYKRGYRAWTRLGFCSTYRLHNSSFSVLTNLSLYCIMAQKVDSTQEPPKPHGPTGPLVTQGPEAPKAMSTTDREDIATQTRNRSYLSNKCATFVTGLFTGPRPRSLGNKRKPGTAAYSQATKSGTEGTRPTNVGQSTTAVLIRGVKPSPQKPGQLQQRRL
jgi:hypothetical protein